jgi:DNA-directed RNA polymerase subunit omega
VEQFLASLAKNEAQNFRQSKSCNPVFKGRESMKLIEGFDSNYRYILVAARRARQLQSGAPPVVQTNSRKPCRIAQDEIRAGKVKWEIPETRSAAEQAAEVLDKAFGDA